MSAQGQAVFSPMNWADSSKLAIALQGAAIGAYDYAHAQGFYDKPFDFARASMLIVTELAEAVEADRHGNPPSDHCPEISGVEEELADVFIRLMDLCGYLGVDLGRAVCIKQAYNLTRPRMHGGKAY